MLLNAGSHKQLGNLRNGKAACSLRNRKAACSLRHRKAARNLRSYLCTAGMLLECCRNAAGILL
jgi:hypothetical protein